MNPTILYEDRSIMVIDKPSGLVVHPFDHSDELTLVDFLKEKIPESFLIKNEITLQDGRTILLGGIVHKLDRDTSGVMVIAKNQVAFDELKSQFVGHTTKKEYVALVEGDITLWEDDALANVKTFTINAPLGRNKKEYRQSTIPSNPRGEFREAITRVELLKVGDAVTLVKLLPKTGRTHQLRAHMSSVGHPIVGDVAYGSKVKSERILLHAKSLTFVSGGKELIFETELPAEFSI